ncbi:virulence RhuM family protein, partial [Patescibacteria group bacterium]|nr:virulence RhuM family protein [Patescibacteria group bacterium]
AFLKFSEYDILNNTGKISHEIAEKLAHSEYEKYKPIQDKNYISDFDYEVKKLAQSQKKDQKNEKK